MITLPTNTVALRPEPQGARRDLLTPIPNQPGHFLFVIDNSSMEKFTTCPQSARNYLVLGREPHAKNAALTFGGALHAGLERFLYKQYDNQVGGKPNDFSNAAENDLENQAITAFFSHHPAPPDEYRTVTTALEVMSHYRRRASFADYQWEILSDKDGPLIERSFELPLGVIEVDAWIPMPWLNGERYIPEQPLDERDGTYYVSHIHLAWSGRIDAIVRCNGRARVCDHKTTSIAGDQFVEDFRISNQVLGYVWAARQLWPELDVSGFVLNAIHLKRPTRTSVLCDLVTPGPRGGEPPLQFFRAYFDYTLARLAQWEHNAQLLVSDFIHCLVRNEFPLHTKWCFGKFGKCPYHDACIIDDLRQRDLYLKSDFFNQVTWNPVRG